jgi:ATP-dependent Zn protease
MEDEGNMSTTGEPGRTDMEWSGLERTAYHEAGHAVMAYFLDVPFGETSIIPIEEENTLGYMKPENVQEFWARLNANWHPVRQMLAIENHVLRLFAGGAAERIFTGTYSEGGIDDYTRANLFLADILAEGTPEDGAIKDGAYKWLHWKACLLTEIMRDEIDTVAQALLKKKILTKSEIVACIEEATANADKGAQDETSSDL